MDADRVRTNFDDGKPGNNWCQFSFPTKGNNWCQFSFPTNRTDTNCFLFDVTDKVSALRLLEESQLKGEFLTGLIYVNSKRRDFVSMQNTTPTPLALLPDDLLRPSKDVLEKIMETI
jgi:hypothetical protein